MIKTGEKIGDYLVKSEIGKGGMGTLYYGIDTMLKREVTLKVIHPEFSKNSKMVAKFKKEAIIQAQMNHPHIVTLFSLVNIEHYHIMVMEFVKGTDLHQLLKQKKTLSLPEAISFVSQILKALNYAHERQIIHGDINPSNIMITHDNNVKITDFGISTIFGFPLKIGNDLIFGTSRYTSPEQILGKGVDVRSDLYSVGITFYEMVTGKVPYNSERGSSIDIEKAHLFQSPPRPSLHYPEIKQEVEDIILKAIQKKPEFRYQSTVGMLDDIDKLTGQKGEA